MPVKKYMGMEAVKKSVCHSSIDPYLVPNAHIK